MNILPPALNFLPEDGSSLKKFGIMLNNMWQQLSSSFNSIFPAAIYTPVITASSGTFTTVSAVGRYRQIGKLIFIEVQINITTNGTATGNVMATLPFTGVNAAGFAYSGMLFGRAGNISGKVLQGYVVSNTNQLSINNYDNTYPGASGEVLILSGYYEIN
jgi:hypothetical protein